jgi:hypothetical protein
VSRASAYQYLHQSIAVHGGGLISAWIDHREVAADVCTQKLEPGGHLGDPAPTISSVIDHPDDQGGTVVLSWGASDHDQYPGQTITGYSVWKRLPDDRDRAGWTWVDEVPATYQTEYGYDAPTYENYGGGSVYPLTEYKVIAHTADPWVFWESGVRSGCSVDNISPGAPLALSGVLLEPVVQLSWSASGIDEEDLSHYNVYRGNNPGFTADADSLIGTSVTIDYTDSDPGFGTVYYRVAGEDVHGNVGSTSNEAAVTVSASTVSATLTCSPSTGTLPFVSNFAVELNNLYQGQTRRIAGRINITLASGASYTNWRGGYTNVAAGETYSVSWNQTLPATAALLGQNTFRLVVTDVTPAPYNQPPYPPAGDTATDLETVTGLAP